MRHRNTWPFLALALYLLLHAVAAACSARVDHPPSVCVFRLVTGLPCPTCGGTRATLGLASGDLALAFRYNPLVTLAWLLMPPLAAALARRRRLRSQTHGARDWLSHVALPLLVVGLVANWFYVLHHLPQLERSRSGAPIHTAANPSHPIVE